MGLDFSSRGVKDGRARMVQPRPCFSRSHMSGFAVLGARLGILAAVRPEELFLPRTGQLLLQFQKTGRGSTVRGDCTEPLTR